MGFFDRFKKMPALPERTYTPYMVGDGLTLETAIAFNCASIGAAHSRIDQFVTERHGQEGIDWRKTYSASIQRESDGHTVHRMSFNLANGGEVTYYFDLTRQIGNTMRMLGIDSDQ